ncbi:hypothetical protein SDC9_72450 [bioreactor metagenome]|uniref:N-acetyltransferase domain-containing protein n=1 Tax=bioreactor metagenome TaxID=1076179 RepID=A0A644YCC9_9ZZZZ
MIGDSENAGSIGLHRSLGFEHAGVGKGFGWKKGRWVDIVWMRKALNGGDASAPDAAGIEGVEVGIELEHELHPAIEVKAKPDRTGRLLAQMGNHFAVVERVLKYRDPAQLGAAGIGRLQQRRGRIPVGTLRLELLRFFHQYLSLGFRIFPHIFPESPVKVPWRQRINRRRKNSEHQKDQKGPHFQIRIHSFILVEDSFPAPMRHTDAMGQATGL